MVDPPRVPRSFWPIVAAGLLLRLAALDLRPLHHDEAVNWYLVERWLGGAVDYDPARFHGPLLYALGALARQFGDHGVWSLRVPVALVGSAMPLLLLPLRRELGGRWLVLASALMALSPTLSWVHRYAIHETLLIAAQLAFTVAIWRAWRDRGGPAWIGAALAAALALATKETAVVGLGAALAALYGAAWFGRPQRQAATAHAAGVRTGPKTMAGALAPAAGVFVGVLALAYSEGGTDWAALSELPRGIVAWAAIGAAGEVHRQPWWYFPMLLLRYEPALLIGALLAWPALRRRKPLPLLLICAALGLLVAYSIPPYKTPWLLASTVVPLALVAAVGLDHRVRRAPVPGWIAVALTLALSAGLGLRLNVTHCTDPREPMVYAQTNEAVHALVAAGRAAAGADSGVGLRIAVVGAEQWPLPFYLRDRRDVAWYTARAQLPAVLPEVLVIDLRAGAASDFPTHRPVGRWTLRPGQTWLLLRREGAPPPLSAPRGALT